MPRPLSPPLATPMPLNYTVSPGLRKPGLFEKAQPGWVFWGFIGFYWVLGFIGFFARAVPAAVSKHGKGK